MSVKTSLEPGTPPAVPIPGSPSPSQAAPALFPPQVCVGHAWAGTPGGALLGPARLWRGDRGCASPGTGWHLPFLSVHIWASQEGLLPSSVSDLGRFSILPFPVGSWCPYLYPLAHAPLLDTEGDTGARRTGGCSQSHRCWDTGKLLQEPMLGGQIDFTRERDVATEVGRHAEVWLEQSQPTEGSRR